MVNEFKQAAIVMDSFVRYGILCYAKKLTFSLNSDLFGKDLRELCGQN